MDKFYPPNFQGYIPLPNGKPAAGGTLIACRTGTDVLAPIYNEDGTLIVGSAAPIDSSGCVHCLLDPTITYRIKIVPPAGEGPWPTMVFDNVRVAECNITGMLNPMTAQYDLIVGGANAKTFFDGDGFDTMDEAVRLELTDSYSLGKDLILRYKVLK